MASTSTRLTKSDRRSQLLDVAADLVLTSGAVAVTMERLAERARVSKALVYLHFENSGAVLLELYLREISRLGAEVVAAIDGPRTPEAKLRAAVRTYFDVVRDRGALFTVMVTAGASATDQAESDARLGHRFVAGLLQQIFDLSVRRSQIAAAMFLGALNGGVEAWAIGELRRREVEEAVVSVALHLARKQ